jgi:hypothetical protein
MKRKDYVPSWYCPLENNQGIKESLSLQDNDEVCGPDARAEAVSRQLGSSAIDMNHKAHLVYILENYTRNHRCSWPDACKALGIDDPDDIE